MCRQFNAVPLEAAREIARQIEAGAAGEADFAVSAFEQESMEENARPGSKAAVLVRVSNGNIEAKELVWGFEVSWQKQLVYNSRIERAAKPDSMWANAFAHGRCIVPVTGFYETHRSETDRSLKTGRPVKRRYRFSQGNGGVFFLAAIAEGSRFSVVTTMPCASVSPVHDRMPIVLAPREIEMWMGKEFLRLSDRSGIDLLATPDTGNTATQLSLL